MSQVLDYKTSDLFIKGQPVDSFCVTGFVVEEALQISKDIGLSTLQAKRLPTYISVSLDGRGSRRVLVHEENRSLAVRVTKAIRTKLHSLDLAVQRVKVEVKNENNKRIGEHDLVLEWVLESAPSGLVSGEVKLRRIKTETGRQKIREALRKECESECRWWQNELSKDNQKWSGRLIVLVDFGPHGEAFETRGDLKLIDKDFRGLWGWKGSSSAAVSKAQPAYAVARPARLPAPRPAAKDWEQFKKVKKLHFRKEKGLLVSSVPAFLKAQGKEANHVKKTVNTGKLRHGWTDNVVFKAPRRADKKGGEDEWVATEAALQKMYENS